MFKKLLKWSLGSLLVVSIADCGRHYYTVHYLETSCMESQISFESQHQWRLFSGSEFRFLKMRHTASQGVLQELRLKQSFPRFWVMDAWGQEGQWGQQKISHMAGRLIVSYQEGWCALFENLEVKNGRFQAPFLRFSVENMTGQMVYRFTDKKLNLTFKTPTLFANNVNCHAVSIHGSLHSFPNVSGDLQMHVQYPSAIFRGLSDRLVPKKRKGSANSLWRFGQKLLERYVASAEQNTSFSIALQEGRLVQFAPTGFATK